MPNPKLSDAVAVPPGLQPIFPGVLYPLPLLQAAVGLRRHGLREARRKGLKVLRLHGRCFITGDAWIEHVQKHGAAETVTDAM